MKQSKKLKRDHKNILVLVGLDPGDYRLMWENQTELHVINKATKELIVIDRVKREKSSAGKR